MSFVPPLSTYSIENYPITSPSKTPVRSSTGASSAIRRCLGFTASLLYETPAETAAFITAGLFMRLLSPSFLSPFAGIGCSFLCTRLVVKVLDTYYYNPLVKIKKEACNFNKTYPKLQVITFIAALAISLLSQTLGFLLGVALGSFGAIVLDVETYKLRQQAKRRELLIHV
jgi:hypothetical protein